MVVKAQAINELQLTLSIEDKLPDDFVAAAYLGFKASGELAHLFYESVPTLREFMDWHRKPDSIWLGCIALDQETGKSEIAGMGWINAITDCGGGHIKAEVGMGFLRKWQRNGIPSDFCDMMIDFCFERIGTAVIYGTTPEPNRSAILFMKRMGFGHLPPMPEFCCWKGRPAAAVFSYMTREMWMHRKEV